MISDQNDLKFSQNFEIVVLSVKNNSFLQNSN